MSLMPEETALDGLAGDNPLGFLAAMGVLEVAHRWAPDARLSWRGRVVPRAVLHGVAIEQVVEWVLADVRDMLGSKVLAWPVDAPAADLKLRADDLSKWAAAVADEPAWVADQWCGLLAENALDNSGLSKPTHLHFTAGQQRFLTMVRELGESLDLGMVMEAVAGPWRYESRLPSLGWDAGAERVYALRGSNPSTEARLGVPGADWLAFRGLSAYPTRAIQGKLYTTACDSDWKRSALRWPVWRGGLTRDVARSVVARRDVVGGRQDPRRGAGRHVTWREQGLVRVYEARIQRTDQGGYGSFAPPTVVWDAGSAG